MGRYVFPGTRTELGAGRGWLDAPAAASLFRVDRAIGHPCQISEAGRTWDQQNRFFQLYLRGQGAIALSPDTPSEHQKGKAVDSNELQNFISLMEEHGWRRTVYRWVNGVWTLVERWHFEYFVGLDRHLNDPEPTIEALSEEDDMLIITATSNSDDGKTIRAGHTYVNTLTSPLTLLSAEEVNALRFWANPPQGQTRVPLRDTTWSGQTLREVMAVRGRRPFDPNTGKTDYNAPIEY